jgi:hypothetical protein
MFVIFVMAVMAPRSEKSETIRGDDRMTHDRRVRCGTRYDTHGILFEERILHFFALIRRRSSFAFIIHR